MVTPIFCCGAECAHNPAGGHWDAQSFSSFSTAVFNNGLRSGRVNTTAGVWQANHTLPTSAQTSVGRWYFHIATAPNANIYGPAFGHGLAANDGGLQYQTSDSKWYAACKTTVGATGITLATGVWHCVDVKLLTNGTTWTCDVTVNGTALGQASLAGQSATNITRVICGDNSVSSTWDGYFDDVMVSQTAADYPIGEGKVLGFVAASDGTHTSLTTTTVKGTIAAPTAGGAITSATTDSFGWQNGVPLLGGATDNTRLVNCQTAASTTYAEWVMQTTSETTAPRAVEIIIVHREASTAVCDATYKLLDNATVTTIGGQSGAGAVSDRYVTKQFATSPATGSAWTLTDFNRPLRVRGGYSSDATPDVYLRGWMCEAEFAVAAAATSLPLRSTIVRQAVNRASTY